jgi:VWFA-related protein
MFPVFNQFLWTRAHSMIRPAGLLAAVLAFSSPLIGQQDSPRQLSQLPPISQTALGSFENRANPPAQELVKLSARSDLVLVPVIVTDKSGRHVPGLHKEAFQIEEDGKFGAVSVFEEIETEKVVSRAKDSTSEGHSNFLPGDDHPWRITIVVLDMINSPWMRQLEAKKRLTDYLLRSALRDEPLAIFGLTGNGLRELHPFTRDTKVLIAALQKLKLSLSSEESTTPLDDLTEDPSDQQLASDEEQLFSDMLSDLDTTVTANYQRIATRETLGAMTQLAHAFQAVPGRKTFIWATAGFPFTIDDPQSFARLGDDLRHEYEDAWRGLISANIAVYPVDLGALDYSPTALPSANTGMSQSKVSDIRGSYTIRSPMRFPYDKTVEQRLTLHAFADATGGRACINVEELEKCFAEAVDDSRAYYLLGYYLGGDTQPGWRKLKVKVTPSALRVRYREGFYVAPKILDTPELRRQQLVDALASPVEYTGLRLTARQLPPASDSTSGSPTEGKKPTDFLLGVMGNSLTIDRENGNAINLQVTTLAFDSNRTSIASMSQAIATKLDADRVERILRTGLGIPEKIDLPPGKYEVKFAVRDNLSGLLGTISVPLELK